jgi:hypothetical protein
MFSPQLADYDGDGLLDIVSGSTCCQVPNCFYVFRRLKDGGFAPRKRVNLAYPRGWPVLHGYLQSPVAVADWNGDGTPDVLIGGHALSVVYGPLAGKDQLTVQRIWPEGQEPFTENHTNPCIADWDGDGLPDLILGCTVGEGRGVYWLRNLGTKRAPKLGQPQLLVADNDACQTTGICVADWNGDGRLDLIASRRETETIGQGRYWPRQHKIWVYLRRGH